MCGEFEGSTACIRRTHSTHRLTCGRYVCGTWGGGWGDGGVRPSVVRTLLPVCNALCGGRLAGLGRLALLALGLGGGGRLGGTRLRTDQHINQLSLGEPHQRSSCGLGCVCLLGCLLGCRLAGLRLSLHLGLELSLVGGFAFGSSELAPCVRAVGGSVHRHEYMGLSVSAPSE